MLSTRLKYFRVFLSFILLSASVVFAFAQKSKPTDAAQFKQLAGPAEEIASMSLPKAETAGTRSKSAMIPVYAADNGRTIEIPVDETDAFNLMLIAPDADGWQVNAALPQTDFVNLKTAQTVERTQTFYGLDGNQFPAQVFKFQAIETGTLRVRLDFQKTSANSSAPVGYLVASSAARWRTYNYVDTFETVAGREFGFVTSLYDKSKNDENTVPAALNDNIRESYVVIQTPRGEIVEVPMKDTGAGVFRAGFTPDEGGKYSAQIFVKGTTPDGNEFLRTGEQTVEVAAAPVSFGKSVGITRIDDLRSKLSIPVQGLKSGRKVVANAEIWGRGGDDSEGAVAWLGGMTLAESKTNLRGGTSLSLTLDTRWLARAKTFESYELRNLRVQDADSSVVLGTAETLALPKIAVSDAAQTFASSAISDEMREGVRPNAPKQTAVGGKLMLVHGYCSSDVWATAANAGQFTNYVKFLDLNQNRSHDQFAQLIKNFGASLPSYGIVAHSQGGAAALHLYTYYWSGLDYATGTRLIQSVGTPYQGTALAGNLAALGSVFGAGCGSNTDLTYSGAAAWLANIPTWARAKVSYSTTSFEDVWYRYDYCSLATDAFLSDPEDGVVEKAYAQLPGAVNMGHKTGWCHTSSMRDPAQTTDAARNSNMNSYAAR